jgi:membrane-bound lytic murein transglycosylase F
MLFNLRRRTDFFHILAVLVLISLPVLVSYNPTTQLDTIQSNGVLRVATRNTPTAYFNDKGEPAGFEYELVNAFADYINVRVELSIPDTIEGLFKAVSDRDVHIAAAGINISEFRSQQYEFSVPYSSSISTVVYRTTQGLDIPQSIEDLIDRKVLILKNSIQAEQLTKLKETHPNLQWEETSELTNTDILDKVFNQEVEFAIVDSVVFDSQSSYYPGLNKAFTIGDEQPIAWVLSPNPDGSIRRAVNQFFALASTRKLIAELQDKYFERRNPLNYFDTVTFKQDLESKLQCLEQYFYMAEQETDIDWMLLSAIAYQESHWKPDAVSPTGVKGIMMLTKAAAKEVNVTDRTDPIQSIMGGAHYLVSVKAKIPDRSAEPDHTWFSLAGYNIGFGHLEDARILTQAAGLNPDKWDDVKQILPRLSSEKYFRTTKYGYARGREPVQYVDNIQKYIELLKWEKTVQQIRISREASKEGNNDLSNSAVTPVLEIQNIPATL